MSRRRVGRLDTLLDMLEYKRPAGSRTEGLFINRYISNLPNAERDEYGNWHVTVGDSPVLWSCHTDTVHWDAGMQKVVYDPMTGVISLPAKSSSNCLGADCTAGVFLMREMILAKVPGHYVFHYAEEQGGVGSSALAAGKPEFLRQFQIAIALDRRGTTDVITHQGFGRSASDWFACTLAAELGKHYAPAHGVYTDTAEYVDIIPECTNISVGYQHEHSRLEKLDSRYLFRLLSVLIKLDAKSLPVERDVVEEVLDWDRRSGWNNDAKDVYDGPNDVPFWRAGTDDAVSTSSQSRTLYWDDDDNRWDSNYLDPIVGEVQRVLKANGMTAPRVEELSVSAKLMRQAHDQVPTVVVKHAKKSEYKQILDGVTLKQQEKKK